MNSWNVQLNEDSLSGSNEAQFFKFLGILQGKKSRGEQ